MWLQQELWLLLVGLLVAWIVRRASGHSVPYARVAAYACLASVLVGELGMLTAWFFPSDVLGLFLTCFSALVAAKFVLGPRMRGRATDSVTSRASVRGSNSVRSGRGSGGRS